MRVLVTGMGGELGTRVAQLLEQRSEVREIAGVDFVPPRRRLRHATFRRIDPRDREKLVAFVNEIAPDAVVHAGVYEPHSRMSPREALERTEACAVGALGAAARTGALERVAVLSGVEVYGRARGLPAVPDERSLIAPASPYGRSCLEVEALARGLGRRQGFRVATLRLAPVVGSHAPSPLGRLLRLPAVPVPAFADPAFSLLHPEDAARAMVEALMAGYDGPLNVAGAGAATPWQAVRLGGRLPVPVAGPGWSVACRLAELAGAPVPAHVLELIRRGRTADGSRIAEALGFTPAHSTQAVCAELYEWGTVTPLRVIEAVA